MREVPFYYRVGYWGSTLLIIMGANVYRTMPYPWFALAWLPIWLGVMWRVEDARTN